eukprot:c6724_g1_i1.p1 GENE.c6724_g1_i1~~c6724_g1_i1.p1  ORF type:complete len:196 (+),score=42.28 c6724_g1_i1:115-702(+)
MFRFPRVMQRASQRSYSTAAGSAQPEADSAVFEAVRLGVRWLVIPCGFFASMKVFGESLGGLAFSEAALAPGLVDRASGVITQSGLKEDGTPGFKFAYTYKGTPYESTTVVPGLVRQNLYPNVPGWTDKYRVGSAHTVFVHPDHPAKGFLEAGPKTEYITSTLIGGLVSYGFYRAFVFTRNVNARDLARLARLGR